MSITVVKCALWSSTSDPIYMYWCLSHRFKCTWHFQNTSWLHNHCDWRSAVYPPTMNPLWELLRSIPRAILIENCNQLGLLSIFIHVREHDLLLLTCTMQFICVETSVFIMFLYSFMQVLVSLRHPSIDQTKEEHCITEYDLLPNSVYVQFLLFALILS